jgi:hypothetical protein
MHQSTLTLFLAAHAWQIVLTLNAIASTLWGLWVTRSIRRFNREVRLRMWADAYEAEKNEKTTH